MQALWLSLLGTLVLVTIPWLLVSSAAGQRQSQIRRKLPELMDMMVVSVEAGLAFDIALARVVEKYQGPVADEFKQVLMEINLGKARKDALKDMAVRVDLPELTVLVNAVVQSEQLGVGIASVLRMQADLIREKRRQFLEEQANKAPVKMVIPLALLIFPVLFIIILGPAVINIKKALGL